jgi:small-conductance mechanosensitive channel
MMWAAMKTTSTSQFVTTDAISPVVLPLSRLLDFCRLLLLAIACGLFWLGPVQAQQEQAEAAPVAEATSDPLFAAPVIVDGVELFMVRGSSAMPASKRAELVASRIIKLAENSRVRSIEMRIDNGPIGKSILANGRLMTVTTEADGELDQMDLDVLSKLQSAAIEKAILDYRANRTSEARVGDVVEALIWTAVFMIVVYLMIRFRRYLPDRAANYVQQRVAGVGKATNDMVSSSAMGALVRYALRLVLLIILLFMTYFYLTFVLLAFAETRPMAQLLITYVTDPLLGVLGGIVSYLPNLITIAIIAAVTRFIIKGVRLFFENVEAGTIPLKNFEKTWIWPTFNIIRVALVLIALVISFPYIPGSDSKAFQGLAILVGVMVSMGSNSVIANALSGMFVIYRRSTNIGDRIKIGEHVGDVVQIKLMETHIKSIKNELISIPNAQLLNSEVINYSTKIDGRGLLLHTTVGIGYEEPQDKIEAMLVEAANRTRSLLKSPEPFVLWTGLTDYAINYQINGYTTRGSRLPKIKSDLHRNIVDVFNENNVQIMTPSYIADPDVPKLPDQEWDGILKGPKGGK